MITMTAMRRPAVAVLAALATLAMLAGPALAQDGQYPPGRGNVNVGVSVTTPCAEIEVEGQDWGGATVEITRTDTSPDDPVDCPDTGQGQGQSGTQSDTQSSADREQVLGTAEVQEDGTFSTTVRVPADVEAGEELEFAVEGTDEEGTSRSEEVAVRIAADSAAASFGPDEGGITVGMALAAALVLAGAGLIYVVRRRRGAVEA